MGRIIASGAWRIALLACFLALAGIIPAAAQEIEPASDILVPWFEVDLTNRQGLDTEFTVVNASPRDITVGVTVYTNWGIPVLHFEHEIAKTESHTCDLDAWIAEGKLPDRLLLPAELADLQAKLTGKPSPVDHLYYSSEVEPDVAVGYVIFSTATHSHADSLWGDVYTQNSVTNDFQADTLVRLTHDLKADCKRHGIRFVNQGELLEGTELIIWSGRRFQPSPTPDPIGAKVKVTLAVYDQEGNHVQDCYRAILAVDSLMVCHLDITPTIGWLDVTTDDESFIVAHMHSATDTSAALHAWCLPESLGLAGPSIAIKKYVAGHDADEPRDAVNIPIGDTVSFTYKVTNGGNAPLTSVAVTDSTALAVTCPKSELQPGESMTCTAHALAAACLHFNLGTATGTTPGGQIVTSTDGAYYFGLHDAHVTIEKRVNGDDADDPTGPRIRKGDSVQWTYVVTNDGAAALHNVSIDDTQVTQIACPKNELAPSESMTCTATSIAAAGQQDNVATVTAYPPCGDQVEASDAAHYFGYQDQPSITIVKLVNGNDANTAPGPAVPLGSALTWSFLVTNTGDVALTDIHVSDNKGIAVECPKTALEAGESMTCTAQATPALPCAQTNRASASGKPPEGGRVSDDDEANYFGTPSPALTLETLVNGNEADSAPGPGFQAGDALAFTYVVTNSGDIALTGISLGASDDVDVTPVCPKTALEPGESMTCTAAAIAHAGQHEHLASVSGTPECGSAPQASDPAYYHVTPSQADIDVQKILVYGEGIEDDADNAPGPTLTPGTPMHWKFVVTNSGNVELTSIALTDDHLGAITCPQSTLAAGASMICVAEDTLAVCSHENHATVTASALSIAPDAVVTDNDPAFYFGQPATTIGFEKLTNGFEADVPPGPVVRVGDNVLWTYVVTNTSNVAMTGVAVTDDRGVTVTCPKTSLQPGESMTCTASGIATRGQYRNSGTVTAQLPCGGPLTATDVSHYNGVLPLISLEKLVAGEDADTAPGLSLHTGDPVLFSYVVTNTGDVELTNVHVADDHGLTVVCPKATLAIAESMTCTASSSVTSGPYTNIGTAYGDALGATVSATDPANYTGTIASIAIEKRTNGQDADTPPGPNIDAGSSVQWTYIVTNNGTVALTGVTVTDDQGVTVTCPKTALEPGESMTCTASGIAVAGQYANIGTATGLPPEGPSVTASDASHYFGRNVGTQGCTPGYWKNHTDSWPPTGYSPSQSVVSVFSSTSAYPSLGSASLIDALAFGGGADLSGAVEIILRAGVAALLNAAHPSVSFPRTPAEVIATVDAAIASGDRDTILNTAAALDADNNLGCPLN